MRNLVADQIEHQGLRCPLACNRDLHVGPFGSFEYVGDIFRVHVVSRLAVHGDNHIAWPNPCLERRGALKWAYHHNLVTLRLNQHADAIVFAVLVFPHLGVGFGVVKAGMWIEDSQHPGNGPVVNGLARFISRQWLGIVLFDQVVDVGERTQIVAQRRFIGARLRAQPLADDGAEKTTNHKKEENREQKPTCAGSHNAGILRVRRRREQGPLLRGPGSS